MVLSGACVHLESQLGRIPTILMGFLVLVEREVQVAILVIDSLRRGERGLLLQNAQH